MPRVKKGAVKEKIVIPEVKENMTKEESQAIIDFFNKFTVHLLLSRKPSQEVMARSKVRFKRAEQKVFSKPYSFYEDYFVGLSNSFFTKENLQKLRRCGDYYFANSKSTTSPETMAVYRKIFDAEVDDKLRLIELDAKAEQSATVS